MAALTAVEDGTQPPPVSDLGERPDLTVVRRRRRWPVVIVGFVVFLVLAAMLGAAVFHTQLAERQVEIDAYGVRVQEERARYAQLRAEIAAKRNPTRLADEAEKLGLTRAPQTVYVEVDKWALARQLAAAGAVPGDELGVIVDADALDQFREVKALSAGRP